MIRKQLSKKYLSLVSAASILLLAGHTTNANPELALQAAETAKIRVEKASRSGRANDAFAQQALRIQNQNNGVLAPPKRGAINNHQIPLKLQNSAGSYDRQAAQSTGTSAELLSTFSPELAAPSVDISTEGYSNDDNANLFGFRITPPDTNGDVGLTHYVQYVNLGWMVFDKTSGAVVAGPFAGNSFWQGFGGICETENAGDPIVLYDHLAGRWLFSQFTGGNNRDGFQCVALSDGEDPLGPYTLYEFRVSPRSFNDYPKIGVWPDGYYMTTHEFGRRGFTGVNLTVFDRQSMLAGDLNAGFIQFTSSTSGDNLEFGVQVGHLEGNDLPPGGTCNYLVHASDAQAFGLTGSDRYRFWKACVDFNNSNNSTLTQINSINVADFDQNFCGFARECIDQNSASGQLVDGLAGFTMYRFNNRYFPGEGVLKSVVTTNVDIGGDQAGVMWAGFDINPTNDANAIGDGGDLLGVVEFGDNLNRWMGSGSVDANGNIGIGYTVAGPGLFPSIAFTVHERNVDGPGAVQAESFCVVGSGSTEGAERWADYASTSVDPVDGCTFWHTNEYVETTGSFEWNTRVCSFRVPSCDAGDPPPVNNPPVASFTDSCTDLDCSFDGSGSSDSDGTIVSYNWDFGDGNTASGVSVSHTYASGGDFNVSLTVTDDDSASSSTSRTVTVIDPNGGGVNIDLSISVSGGGSRPRINLSWTGATTAQVDIYRNGALITTTANDGAFTDRPGRGSFDYQVCNQGSTSDCSPVVNVSL